MTQHLMEMDRKYFTENSDDAYLGSFRLAMIQQIKFDTCIGSYQSRIDTDYMSDYFQDNFAQMIEDALEDLSIQELEECFNYKWVGEAPKEPVFND